MRHRSYFVYIFCIFVASVASIEYEKIQNVVPLTETNFDQKIANGRWLVIFHLNTCGGCISYSEHFERFAQDVANWPQSALDISQFRIGAVECHTSSSLCTRMKLHGVPSLRYFPVSLRFLRWERSRGISLPTYRDLDILRREVVSLIIKEVALFDHRSFHDPSELEVISSSALENTLIILQFWKRLGQPMINVVDPGQPTMRVRYVSQNKYIASGKPHEVSKALNDYIRKRGVSPTVEVAKTTRGPYWYDTTYIQPMTIQAADIFLSLTKALFSDVSMVEKIEGDNLAALKEFLGMLTLLLPASDHYLNKLNELYRWVQGQAGFTGSEWANHLTVSAFPKYSGQYDLCRSAHPQYHGYPCGLWLLFHALTVSHYENELAGVRLPGDIVAHAMNRFIPRFFSCQICAFHFAENSANIIHPGESILPNRAAPAPEEFTFNSSVVSRLPPAPVDGKTEVLWLNAIHNRVNENLRGSPTDDPFAPKLVYPHRWLCSACWIRSRSKQRNWVLGGDQRSRSALLNFLVKRYSSSRWMSDKISKSFFVSEKSLTFMSSYEDLSALSIWATALVFLSLLALLYASRKLWTFNLWGKRRTKSLFGAV